MGNIGKSDFEKIQKHKTDIDYTSSYTCSADKIQSLANQMQDQDQHNILVVRLNCIIICNIIGFINEHSIKKYGNPFVIFESRLSLFRASNYHIKYTIGINNYGNNKLYGGFPINYYLKYLKYKQKYIQYKHHN